MSPWTVAALALVLGALGCWLLAGLGRAAAKPAPTVPAQRAPWEISCEVDPDTPLAVGDEFRAYLIQCYLNAIATQLIQGAIHDALAERLGADLVAEAETWLAKAAKEEM